MRQFQEYIERIQKSLTSSSHSPACPTCNRAFQEKAEAEELIEDLKSEVVKIPKKVMT